MSLCEVLQEELHEQPLHPHPGDFAVRFLMNRRTTKKAAMPTTARVMIVSVMFLSLEKIGFVPIGHKTFSDIENRRQVVNAVFLQKLVPLPERSWEKCGDASCPAGYNMVQ